MFLHYLAKIKTQKLHTFSVLFCVALLTNTHTWARAVSLYCGNVSSAGWQVTLCDPVWHVSSRSSEACYMLLIPVTLLYNVEWNALCWVSITTVRVICVRCYTRTHTHTFNGPFSGTTRVSRYQKGKTNLDFTEARDSGWQWHQLGHTQVCTSLQTDNHASTSPLSFLQAGCPSCRPTNSVKALKVVVFAII